MSCSTSRMPVPRSATTRTRISPNCAGLVAVKARRGLVEQQEAEGSGQAAGQLDQPPLAGRQRAGLLARPDSIPHRARASVDAGGHPRWSSGLPRGVNERRPRPCWPLGRGPRSRHRERVVQLHLLEGPTEAPTGPGRRRRTASRRSRRKETSGVGLDEGRAGVEHGGLPAPFGPISPVMRPWPGREAQVVDGHQAAEAHGEVLDLEAEGWPGRAGTLSPAPSAAAPSPSALATNTPDPSGREPGASAGHHPPAGRGRPGRPHAEEQLEPGGGLAEDT